MHLFTSDLDRTLIFSKRSIGKEISGQICIETIGSHEISYVTPKIRDSLCDVNNKMQFVPVTTRALEQYNRLQLFQNQINPEIVILANGGMILRHGQIDDIWQKTIQQMMDDLSLPLSTFQSYFKKQLAAPYFIEWKLVDEIFFLYFVDLQKVDFLALEQFQQQIEACGWISYLQGRKFYILPQQLTKGAAVAYIKNQRDYELHFAAGDSLMDKSMLQLADYGFVPRHGELVNYLDDASNMEIIEATGADFAEQCLSRINLL